MIGETFAEQITCAHLLGAMSIESALWIHLSHAVCFLANRRCQ